MSAPDAPGLAGNARVTLHMAASLDGFIARRDGRVDWMHTTDEFEGGTVLAPDAIAAFLATIDCYVMGARTYETALRFEAEGHGWAYGDTPTFVLTHGALPCTRPNVTLVEGDVAELFGERMLPVYRNIWIAGGPALGAACLARDLVDEIRYTILPVLIGDGVPFFTARDVDTALHLAEVTPYRNGMVELRYEVTRRR